MAQPQIFIGKRNLKGPEPANTAGVWKMYDMNQMRHYDYIIGTDGQDPYFNNTTLLIKSTALNGGRNNTILDSSLNPITLTRNGDINHGSFSPYANNWSVHFDGTGDYLTVGNNSAFNFGSGNFTIEAWIYLSADASADPDSNRTADICSCMFDTGASGNGWAFWIDGNTTTTGTGIVFDVWNTTRTRFSASTTVAKYTWHHIAVVRNGSNLSIYLNGSSVLSSSISVNADSGGYDLDIGSFQQGTAPKYYMYFPGYISNLRLVKGTAVYTSAFTPPTSFLTAITNTSLLTCRQNRFMDSSTNAFTITVNGDSRIDSFSPFTSKNFYNAYDFGGSIFFDGNVDYFQTSPGFGVGIGADFTFEGWLYRTVDASNFIMGVNGSSDYIADGDAYISSTSYGYGGNRLSVKNAWSHFALVRSGSTVTIYRNGVLLQTAGSSFSAWSFNRIGAWNSLSSTWQGYMSDIRVSNIALYTSAFTPPTSRLTANSNTILLLSSTNYNIFDATQRNNISTNGDVQNSTTIRKNEICSVSFDGTGDTLLIQDNPMLRPDSGNFTLEFWVRFNNISGYQTIIHKGYNGANAYAIQTGNGNGRLIFYIGGAAILTESGTGSAGTWIHYAIVRDGNNYTMYRDGVSSVTATNSTNLSNNSTMVIGDRGVGSEYGTPAYPLNGYIENLRFTKGIARYTANFTPPTIYYTR